MKEQKGFIELIVNNFTIVVASFIIIGIIQINDYYRYFFNFDVIPYLTTSEVLTQSFISLGNFSLGNLITGTFSFTIILYLLIKLILWIYKRPLFKCDDLVTLQIDQDLLVMIVSFALGIFLFQGKGDTKFTWNIDNIIVYPIQSFVAGIVIMSTYTFVMKWFKKDEITPINLNVSTAILWFFLFSFFHLSERAYNKEGVKIKSKKYFKGTVVKTSDETFISDSSSSYIGRTTNDVFIYNFKEQSVLVLPASEIKSIKVVANN